LVTSQPGHVAPGLRPASLEVSVVTSGCASTALASSVASSATMAESVALDGASLEQPIIERQIVHAATRMWHRCR
jgi:hypothetical protein